MIASNGVKLPQARIAFSWSACARRANAQRGPDLLFSFRGWGVALVQPSRFDGKRIAKTIFLGNDLMHLMAAIFGVSWKTEALKAVS